MKFSAMRREVHVQDENGKATATFQGTDVDWYIKAEDIILKSKNGQMQNQSVKKENANGK